MSAQSGNVLSGRSKLKTYKTHAGGIKVRRLPSKDKLASTQSNQIMELEIDYMPGDDGEQIDRSMRKSNSMRSGIYGRGVNMSQDADNGKQLTLSDASDERSEQHVQRLQDAAIGLDQASKEGKSKKKGKDESKKDSQLKTSDKIERHSSLVIQGYNLDIGPPMISITSKNKTIDSYEKTEQELLEDSTLKPSTSKEAVEARRRITQETPLTNKRVREASSQHDESKTMMNQLNQAQAFSAVGSANAKIWSPIDRKIVALQKAKK